MGQEALCLNVNHSLSLLLLLYKLKKYKNHNEMGCFTPIGINILKVLENNCPIDFKEKLE